MKPAEEYELTICDTLQRPSHRIYCLTNVLLRELDFTTEGNGFTDSRQVLIHRVNGEEIIRSEGGSLTFQPLFAELIIAKIKEIYP